MQGGMEMVYSEGHLFYYAVLGVCRNASEEEIRRAYRKLAMQWHPDKWTRTPYLLGKAKQNFQQIQEAYSVLSDRRKRILYDAGLFDPNEEEEDEEFADFLQEMMALAENVRKENKVYSLEELQTMFSEMAESFETSGWSSQSLCGSSWWLHEPFTFNYSGNSSNVPNSDGKKSFETLMRESWSDSGASEFTSNLLRDAWSTPFFAL